MRPVARKLGLRFCLVASVFAALAGCIASDAVSSAEVSGVLTEAAMLAAQKLPPSYCLEKKLDGNHVKWPATTDKDGWIDDPLHNGLKFRKVPAAHLGTLPDSAIAIFQSRSSKDCRHKLVFSEPVFTETRSPSGSILEAVVEISDYCPLCGGGYEVRFEKLGNRWVATSEGLVTNIVS